MKKFIVFIFFLLLVFLQISFSLPNLALGALILFLVLKKDETLPVLAPSHFTGQTWLFTLAFFLGLSLDLTRGGWWGLSSAFFLLVVFFFLLYQKRFFARSLLFLSLFTFLTSLLYDFFILGRFWLFSSLSLVVLVLLTYILLGYFSVGSKGLKIDLREKR